MHPVYKVSQEGRDLVRFMGLKWRFAYKVPTLSSDLVHVQGNEPDIRGTTECRTRDFGQAMP